MFELRWNRTHTDMYFNNRQLCFLYFEKKYEAITPIFDVSALEKLNLKKWKLHDDDDDSNCP